MLRTYYIRDLQDRAFRNALAARVAYNDHEGSDDILNAIVTQAEFAGRVIRFVIVFLEEFRLSLMYLSIAFVLAPLLTLFAVWFLDGFSAVFRYLLESGYDIGDRVADANERVQEATQAGKKGIQYTKLFGLRSELFSDFIEAAGQFTTSSIKHRRNQQAIRSFYNLLVALDKRFEPR